MSSKHVNTPADLDKGYEENEVQVRGIVGFGVGLLLLIVFTFGLMALFLYLLPTIFAQWAEPANPMAMSEKEKLPAEPRLQSAPGFGVDSPNGRVNLELTTPQSEYREIKKQWDELLEKGRIDPKTGVVTMMPIEKAKEKLLESKLKAKSGPDAEKLLKDSRMFYSDASAGRHASETRR